MSRTQPAEGQSSGGPAQAVDAGVWSPEVARDIAAAIEMIASGRTLPTVLAFLARAVERHVPGTYGSVLVATEDGRSLIHGAAPSLPESFKRAVDGLEIAPEAGACAAAAYTGTRVWSEDMSSDPRWAQWHELAAAHGVRACYSLPITSPEGAVLGTFALYSRDRRTPPERLEMLDAAARLAALAIDRERTKNSEARMRRRADRDLLTGLHTRRHLVRVLSHALSEGAPVTVLLIDLDEFGTVNEEIGHQAADATLVVVGRRLLSASGARQLVARVSGDRFALVADGDGAERALMATAHRFLETLARPVNAAGRTVRVSASAGLASAPAGSQARPDEVLRYAEAALDRAKRRGGARVEVLGEQAKRRLAERIALEHELREAIERGQLELVYQPIVSLEDGRLEHVEALVRWRRPDGHVVAPSTFVPVAEESGLIRRLGAWVLEAACRQIAAWSLQTPESAPPAVAVNVSARQLVDPLFPSVVAEVLERARLDPATLVLEVTETALLEATESTTAVMKRLNDLGVRIILDDFGDGFSSLAHLRWFPVHGLKIDRSLIADLGSSPEAAPLVEAVVAMARAVGVTVVAEGVETQAQLEAVRAAGCQMAQGYALGRPAPPAALTRR